MEGNGTWNEKQTAAINAFNLKGIANFLVVAVGWLTISQNVFLWKIRS